MKPAVAVLIALASCASIPGVSRAQAGEAVPPNCEQPGPAGDCALYGVSMIELLANPAKYDGKRVRLTGYIHFEFEGNGIYLHEEDEVQHLYRNGLWVELAEGVPRAECQDSYALIEGTFRAGHRGHLGLWSGAVTDITRCRKWR